MALSVEVRSGLTDAELREYDTFLDSLAHAIVQQSGLWSRVIKDIGQDVPFYIIVRDGRTVAGILTVYLYRNELGNILFSNPQAGSMASIAVHPASERGAVAALLVNAAKELALTQGCLSLTLTSNPFEEDILGRCINADYLLSNRIHYLPPQDCFDREGEYVLSHSKFRNNLKRNISRALKAGFTVEDSVSKAHLFEWYGIHLQRMREVNGIPIPLALFKNALAWAVPSERAAFHYVFDEKGRVQGGGFHIYNGQVADIIMMSTSRHAQERGGNYLLGYEALKWAQGKGLKIYNWQASNPPEGSVARFKEQWGSRTSIYHYYTKVLGDLSPLLKAGIQNVREAYRWHYVIPFGIFTASDRHTFSKADSEAFLPA